MTPLVEVLVTTVFGEHSLFIPGGCPGAPLGGGVRHENELLNSLIVVFVFVFSSLGRTYTLLN